MAATKTVKNAGPLLAIARKGAAAAFRAAIEQVDDKELVALADDLEGARLFKAAEAVYRLLIERAPGNVTYWYGLGFNLYYHQRKPDEAATHYTEALRRFPGDDDLLRAAGVNLAWGAGRYADALPLLQAASDAAPRSGSNRSTLAWCLLCLGRVDEGLAKVRGALNLLTDASDADERLAAHAYLYLLGPGDKSGRVLRLIARAVAAGTTVPDWNFAPLVAQARAQDHPEAERLDMLVAVVNGVAKADTLAGWPAWRTASRLYDWPEGIEPPPALEGLVRFAAGGAPEGYSATFAVELDEDGAAFYSRPDAARDLAIFGRDADGSHYAFWLAPARDATRAPIVYLPSDGGEKSLVVATGLTAFLALMGLCLPDIGGYAEDSEPWAKSAIAEWREESPLSSREKQFRRWLKSELGIEVPTAAAAEAIMREARGSQPAFDAWLQCIPPSPSSGVVRQ